MNETSMTHKRKRLGTLCKVMLVVLVLAGLGTAGHAAASPDGPEVLLPGQIYIFDPFDLSSTAFAVAASGGLGAVDSGEVLTLADRPAIRIPSRPALRSPFRPPLS